MYIPQLRLGSAAMAKRTPRAAIALPPEQLRKLAEQLVLFADELPAIQRELENAGYRVHRLFQEAVMSLAQNKTEAEAQLMYWKEVAKERLGCLGKFYSVALADYPDICVYRSVVIDRMRVESLGRGDSHEVAPLLMRFDDGRGLTGGTVTLDKAILERKVQETKALAIKRGKPFDFAFARNDERYAALADLYREVSEYYGFGRDSLRTKDDYLCFSKSLAPDWEICWVDESFNTPFVIQGQAVLTKRGRKFDTRHPSPGVIARFRLNDLIPGLWRYLTDGDRRDFTTLGLHCSFFALDRISISLGRPLRTMGSGG
jgi:hypothetical protein